MKKTKKKLSLEKFEVARFAKTTFIVGGDGGTGDSPKDKSSIPCAIKTKK